MLFAGSHPRVFATRFVQLGRAMKGELVLPAKAVFETAPNFRLRGFSQWMFDGVT